MKFMLALPLCLSLIACAEKVEADDGWEKFFPEEQSDMAKKVDAAPVDKGAGFMTKRVYSYLKSCYGKNILLGDPNLSVRGSVPKIIAYDLMFYTQGCIDSGDRTEDGIPYRINWYNKYKTDGGVGGIITLHWHWYAPKDGFSYYYKNSSHPNGTTFDVSLAVTEGTEENALVIRDIDAIAANLRRFGDEDIPILFRPLHEAGGSDGSDAWFWWGAKGPEPCIELWRMMYDRLTNYHKLHNLIWVWSSPVDGWYPGNEYVDILGYDSYPEPYDYGSQSSYFRKLYGMCDGKKMIAMTENGPIPDIDRCFKENSPWLFFMTWYDHLDTHNTEEHITEVLANDKLIKLE